MKCHKCGNEVSPEEAFCGQCGTPIVLPSQAGGMVSAPPPHSGPLQPYGTNRQVTPQQSLQLPQAERSDSSYQPSAPTQHVQLSPSLPDQQEGFYQDATEAMLMPPANANQGYVPGAPGYQQPLPPQSYRLQVPPVHPQPSPSRGYVGQQNYPPLNAVQPPLHTKKYAGANYPPQASPPQGSQYGISGRLTPPTQSPQQQQNRAVVIIASICLTLALLSLVGITTFYFTQNHTNHTNTNSSQAQIATATPVPTTEPSPTPTIEPSPTPTTAPTPTPAITPTPIPDANFSWCGQMCINYGFTTEYPTDWNRGQPQGSTIAFSDPTQTNVYASFKANGQTTSSANELVTSDLEAYTGKPGYQSVTPSPPTVTIDGETWIKSIAYYEADNSQKEHVEVFATVHQGKGYTIELQASESQFDTVNQRYFVHMIDRFQFQ